MSKSAGARRSSPAFIHPAVSHGYGEKKHLSKGDHENIMIAHHGQCH
jgi:hypothetical protein